MKLTNNVWSSLCSSVKCWSYRNQTIAAFQCSAKPYIIFPLEPSCSDWLLKAQSVPRSGCLLRQADSNTIFHDGSMKITKVSEGPRPRYIKVNEKVIHISYHFPEDVFYQVGSVKRSFSHRY